MEEEIARVALMFVPFLMAVVFHEYAHGFIAARFGDTTAKDSGRLSLSPIAHIDPLGTLLLPIVSMMMFPGGVLFGWAKPVPINPSRFRKYRPGLFWVSFAGPLMNFLLATIFAVLGCVMVAYVSPDFQLYSATLKIIGHAIVINFSLGFFNLLPLPPLDGSKIIQSFLSYNATMKYEAISAYSFWILMALIMTGVLRFLTVPVLWSTATVVEISSAVFNLDPYSVFRGFGLIQ